MTQFSPTTIERIRQARRAGEVSRAAHLQRLTGETFDLLVIGGGATGLGVAVDAASRGLRTAIVEAHDWAKCTSSRSTKLVHGGVRYLEQMDFGLVTEALHERGVAAVLTWGNDREHARCMRLAARMREATIAPALDFGALAGLFAGAQAVIGVDTGLSHLAAALGVPTVGIYLGTIRLPPASTAARVSSKPLMVIPVSFSPSLLQHLDLSIASPIEATVTRVHISDAVSTERVFAAPCATVRSILSSARHCATQ